MENQPHNSAPETPDMLLSGLVAEYKFIISYDRYPRDEDIPLEDWERKTIDLIEYAINRNFTNEVGFLFGGLLEVKVGPIEQGSILGTVMLVLASTVTAAEFLSKYKDFYDSLILLKSHLRSILNRIANHEMRSSNSYQTISITFIPGPVIKDLSDNYKNPPATSIPPRISRGFLIYLLVMNVVLMLIIFALVYHAVAVVYFGIH